MNARNFSKVGFKGFTFTPFTLILPIRRNKQNIVIIKDSIYKIRNDVCFSFVDNHETYPFLYSTFLSISKTEFPKSIRLLVKEWDMYH